MENKIENETITTATSGYMQVINMMPVYVKKVDEYAKLPTRGSDQAAGFDFYAHLKEMDAIYINPWQTVLIGTGIQMALPQGTFLGIYPRSGLASKKGLRPANCVGVVDSDYRGEIMVALHNDTSVQQKVEDGERIAQGILHHYMPMDFVEVEDLDETGRGANGFGSTGKK